MAQDVKKVPAVFYRTAAGVEPVREWIMSLPAEDRRIIGFDVALIEFGWPVGMPLCRSLGGGLWEVRSHLSGGRIARVLFCVGQGRMSLLHGFVKKTQKTPAQELDTARKRQRNLEND